MLYDREMLVGYNVKFSKGELVECHGFHEVGGGADVELTSVEIMVAGKGVDILPLLDKNQVEEICNELTLSV